MTLYIVLAINVRNNGKLVDQSFSPNVSMKFLENIYDILQPFKPCSSLEKEEDKVEVEENKILKISGEEQKACEMR